MRNSFCEHLKKETLHDNRKGSIVVLSAVILVVILIFAAFTVDIGYIAATKSQLQNASDSAAISSCLKLVDGVGTSALYSESESQVLATNTAVDVAAANKAGEYNSVFLDSQRDIQFGNVRWDSNSQTWVKFWGATPSNMVQVTLHRDQGESSAGDGSLQLFIAPFMGHDMAGISTTSTVAFFPGGGFKIAPGGQNVGILPIALDLETWEKLMNGVGDDDYTFSSGIVSNGCDGILEVNIYPTGSTSLPPGNRGTVDIGSSNNSTADLSRQILYGISKEDLSYFGGELNFDDAPLALNGDTGLSAGIKDELEAIKGKPRAIPIFSQVSGPGNNAMFTIVKFVGVRILDIKLTGSPSQKHVIIQPAPFSSPSVIPGTTTIEPDSIFTSPRMIQ